MMDSDRDSRSPSASPAASMADCEMSDEVSPVSPGSQPSMQIRLKTERGGSPRKSPDGPRGGSTGSGTSTGPAKQTKRRAARACVSCRARKVRCDVVETSPCGNCKWDGVKCEVQESRRRKKTFHSAIVGPPGSGGPEMLRSKSLSMGVGVGLGLGVGMASQQIRMAGDYGRLGSMSDMTMPGGNGLGGHLEAGPIFQRELPAFVDPNNPNHPSRLIGMGGAIPWNGHTFGPMGQSPVLGPPPPSGVPAAYEPIIQIPPFIKPLPAKLTSDDVQYLFRKGALMIPGTMFQNALLRAYIEFVHPFMPLLELNDFVRTVHGGGPGRGGQVSLLLYQAVMFVSVAFVDDAVLEQNNYSSRKAARKDFFSRVRLLYDFDVEGERHVLVQALLLMTYWYETPDDQKDTWHWMGVAISLAHTIGLHRNPANIKRIDGRKQKLFKRIWWSCFMRDRLIALGMRRPTRIQDEDFDVPMLQESDFEIEVLADENQLLGPDCTVIRDTAMQRQLALMCIEKAKLCVCISHMLKVQYSVLSRDGMRPDNTTASTMMLFPNKTPDNFESVQRLDGELKKWYHQLPECCQDGPVTEAEASKGHGTVALQRTLLHMVYQATVAALHRPQFLPASPQQGPSPPTQIQELARTRVHESARRVIEMATQLRQFQLDQYLPTTGVTVILPALIIHLLEIRNPDPVANQSAWKRYEKGMEVLKNLQDRYAAADFAARFLHAAFGRLSAGGDSAFQKPKAPQQQREAKIAAMTDISDAIVPTTPRLLPDNTPYLTPTQMHIYQTEQPYMARDGNSMATGVCSPPPTDSESERHGITTPVSKASSTLRTPEGSSTICPQQTDIWDSYPMPTQQQHFNLDADFEVSQWLQFPAEGVSNSDEAMIDMFSSNEVPADIGDHSYGWTKSSHQHPQQPLQQQFQHNMESLTMMNISTAGPAA